LFGIRSKKLAHPQVQSSDSGAKAQGDWAEELACQWLMEQGLVLRDRNFRTRYGEIDLIMQSGDCLIFVEVRYRKTVKFGSAEESITSKKCQKLTAAAQGYLLANSYESNTPIRFDAVALSPSSDSYLGCTINWIQNILT
jgi:putative endonuclease